MGGASLWIKRTSDSVVCKEGFIQADPRNTKVRAGPEVNEPPPSRFIHEYRRHPDQEKSRSCLGGRSGCFAALRGALHTGSPHRCHKTLPIKAGAESLPRALLLLHGLQYSLDPFEGAEGETDCRAAFQISGGQRPTAFPGAVPPATHVLPSRPGQRPARIGRRAERASRHGRLRRHGRRLGPQR